MTPLLIIDSLRASDPYIKTIFTQGSCYKFHLFLKTIFPDAMAVCNENCDHIGSLIEGTVYDINGIVDWGYRAIYDDELAEIEGWSFCKNQWLNIGDCPSCGEPIPV